MSVCGTDVAPVGTARTEVSSAVCDIISSSLLWCPEGVGVRAVDERKKLSDQVFVCEFEVPRCSCRSL